MKVAIVHDFIFKLGGAERVVAELADMYPDAPIYTSLFDEEKCKAWFDPQRVISSDLQNLPLYLRRRPQYLLKKYPQAMESFDLSEFDLVISSSGAFSHGVITPPQTKHLCYCHSPMRYAWDYTHEYLEEKKLNIVKELMIRKAVHQVRQWDRAAADRPDQYLANSKHVAKRIRKYYQQESHVLYPPVDVDRFYPFQEPGDYFLIVSALTPFKKIDLAISAFNKMGKKLIVVGGGAEEQRLRALAGPTVTVTGRVTDEEVKNYLQGCRGLIFPGEEDFGITPVEAMAAGRPVIAYRKGGVTESVVDGITGVFFEEQTVQSLEAALARFYELESSFDVDIIVERAQQFSRQQIRKGLRSHVQQLMQSSS